MKTLLSLLTFILSSCASIDKAAVIESDTDIAYPASHLDSLRGMASWRRDAEMRRFADAIIAKAGKVETDDSGTFYPGTVKVLRWQQSGAENYTALRLARFADGTEAWQGPTPPSGFYGCKLRTEYLH